MNLGMCKIEISNGIAKLDEETVKTLLTMSGNYATNKVLPEDFEEQCKKNNINPDGLKELIQEVVGEMAGMCYGMIFCTESATKELAKTFEGTIKFGTDEEYENWKQDKDTPEFKGECA